jgi:signal peptidase I
VPGLDATDPVMHGTIYVESVAGHVFLLGDNRHNSHDSRFIGPVPIDHIRGSIVLIDWSQGPEGPRCDRILEVIE